ncbi:variable surface lipoprotein [Metamycoplasma hominis]|uniref:variable surface lipoprotein n=1 Tax=Metamycoplasma hominis TaxID=2098 RepID=UPI0006968317|nr:variable surface lipoprotein [Metamycoplasma hominis]UIU37953.1 variable surface lipoprotein [Metamycoplasma hominis]
MKKSKKILLTMGVVLPLLASTPLVAAGCVKTKKPEVKPEEPKKPEGEKPGTTPEVKPEGEKSEEQKLLEKRNKLIKETEAKWDDITKKIYEYSKDAIISKFPEFIQITDYLKYKKVELKDLKTTKNNTIKLLVAKYFNILEAKILENKTFIENIINKNKEIKDDELNKTKSLLNELNKEIEKREEILIKNIKDNFSKFNKEIKDDELNKTKSLLNELNKEIKKREEEQNLLEKRNNLIKETEAKWDDITKKIDEYSKDAKISKFSEFTKITNYLAYKKVELKDLKTTKNNTIKLLVAKYLNILEEKISKK